MKWIELKKKIPDAIRNEWSQHSCGGWVKDTATIGLKAKIYGIVDKVAVVGGSAVIGVDGFVTDQAFVLGDSFVNGLVIENAVVYEKAIINSYSTITGYGKVRGHAVVKSHAVVKGVVKGEELLNVPALKLKPVPTVISSITPVPTELLPTNLLVFIEVVTVPVVVIGPPEINPVVATDVTEPVP